MEEKKTWLERFAAKVPDPVVLFILMFAGVPVILNPAPAQKASAISVTRPGAQSSVPFRKEIK